MTALNYVASAVHLYNDMQEMQPYMYQRLYEFKQANVNVKLEVHHHTFHDVFVPPSGHWGQAYGMMCIFPDFDLCSAPAKMSRLREAYLALLARSENVDEREFGKMLYNFIKNVDMALTTKSAKDFLTMHPHPLESWNDLLTFAVTCTCFIHVPCYTFLFILFVFGRFFAGRCILLNF